MNDELIRELDLFLNLYGLADSTFGIRVSNDSHLLERVRAGKPIRRSTVLKIRKFMAQQDAAS
jgi:hypothetical protein